jgi:hypothetical protein
MSSVTIFVRWLAVVLAALTVTSAAAAALSPRRETAATARGGSARFDKTRPPHLRARRPSRHMPTRSLQDYVIDFVSMDPVFCNASQMLAQMPTTTVSGATWVYWWPQVEDWSVVAEGPLFARSTATNSIWWSRDGGRSWFGPYSSSLGLSATIAAPGLYTIYDNLNFRFSDGTMSGWQGKPRSALAYDGPYAVLRTSFYPGCLY